MKIIASLAALFFLSAVASVEEKRDTDVSYMRHAAAATHEEAKRCTSCPTGTFAITLYNSNNGVNTFAGYLNIANGQWFMDKNPPNPPIFFSDHTNGYFGIQIVNKPALAGQYLALESTVWGSGVYTATGTLGWHALQNSGGVTTNGWTMGPVVITPSYEWATNKYYTSHVYVQSPLVVGGTINFDVTLGSTKLTTEQMVQFGTAQWSYTQTPP